MPSKEEIKLGIQKKLLNLALDKAAKSYVPPLLQNKEEICTCDLFEECSICCTYHPCRCHCHNNSNRMYARKHGGMTIMFCDENTCKNIEGHTTTCEHCQNKQTQFKKRLITNISTKFKSCLI